MTKLGSVEYSRPVSGEPLALGDLINTAWPDGEGLRDVLASRSGHEEWLRENDLPGPSTAAARKALLQARRDPGGLETPGPAALAALDGILERGRLRIRATQAQCREEVEVEREWRVPWLAVRSLLQPCSTSTTHACATAPIRLPVLVPRHRAPNAPLVLHDRLREPPQGPTPLPAAASRLTAASSAATAEAPAPTSQLSGALGR